MRLLGLLLMWIGVLAASLFSVTEVAAISWPLYGGAIAVGLVGVVLLRLTAKAAAHHHHRVNEDLATMRSTLTNVVTRLQPLVEAGEAIDVYGVKDRIDRELSEDLARFADARESMIPALGLTSYAEVMTRFAGGERLVNRAWSASADGYLDEVVLCLAGAHAQLVDARAHLERYIADRKAEG
ncbi:MAG: hypothetical protein KC420_00560 [Myxococcales bacterium]|nr:hypothetical protein [Myxococcales bacterium]MCB9568138.1 hypothetical protein [Myxococcales bacterium]MCB9705366.1 hypothetical protein [Myxococcales bacterium]